MCVCVCVIVMVVFHGGNVKTVSNRCEGKETRFAWGLHRTSNLTGATGTAGGWSEWSSTWYFMRFFWWQAQRGKLLGFGTLSYDATSHNITGSYINKQNRLRLIARPFGKETTKKSHGMREGTKQVTNQKHLKSNFFLVWEGGKTFLKKIKH